MEDFQLRGSRGFKEGSSAQLAGAREQLLGDPMAHLAAQEAAGEVLAVWTPNHASIRADFFHPVPARIMNQFDHLIGDAVGLELASNVSGGTRKTAHTCASGLNSSASASRPQVRAR